MDRETCEHGAPVSQICDRCDLTAVDRLGLAISNAGVTWTNEMREEWDKTADEIKLLRLKLKEVINECGEYEVVIKDFAQIEKCMEQELAECKQRQAELIVLLRNVIGPNAVKDLPYL